MKVKMKNNDNQLSFHTSCWFCGMDFDSFSDKKIHLEKVHVRLLPQCTLCGLKFAFPQKLAGHVRNKCSPESGLRIDGTFQCKACDFSSNLQSNVTIHVILKHKQEKDKGEKCPVCGKKIFWKKSQKAFGNAWTAVSVRILLQRI